MTRPDTSGRRAFPWISLLSIGLSHCAGVEPSRQYAIGSLTVVDGHPIKGNPDGVLLSQSFDEQCRLVPESESHGENTLAGSVGTTLDLEATFISCPASPDPPSVRCSAQVDGELADAPPFEAAMGSWTVALPALTGTYELVVDCALEAAGVTRHETVTRKLFVTYSDPLSIVSPAEPQWYEKATSWGKGFPADAAEEDILQAVLMGGFAYGATHWRYGSFMKDVPNIDPTAMLCWGEKTEDPWCSCSWKSLVDDESNCHFADCYEFAEVFENIASTLGIGVFEAVEAKGSRGQGFLTVPSASLDPRFPGNVDCDPVDGDCPNYLFSSHSLRERDGVLYDATFGRTYDQITSFIAINVRSWTSDVMLEGSGDQLVFRDDGYGSWPYYTLHVGGAPQRHGGQVRSGAGAFPPSPPQMSTPNIVAVGNGVLTDVSVDLPSKGRFTISAELFDEDTSRPISVRSHHRDPTFNRETVEGPGEHHVQFRFSGEDIYRSREEGRFGVKVSLFDAQSRVVASTSALAKEIESTALGETFAKIAALGVEPLDENGNGKFEALRVTVQLDQRRSHLGAVVARLASSDDVTIGYGDATFDESTPRHQIVMTIPAGGIVDKKLAGPYELTVELLQHVVRDDVWRATGFVADGLEQYRGSDFERIDGFTIRDETKN